MKAHAMDEMYKVYRLENLTEHTTRKT